MDILVEQFSLIFPLFPRRGRNWFPRQGILFPHWGNTIPQFSPNFPLIFQFPVQFSIQLHKCTLSLSLRPILCILHVSLKMRILHYARQRILNLGNSGEVQGDSGEIRWKAFYFFSLVFPGVKYISLSGNLIPLISPVATVKTGENSCEKNWKGIYQKTWITLPCHLISRSPQEFSIAQYCSQISVMASEAWIMLKLIVAQGSSFYGSFTAVLCQLNDI